MARNHCKDCVKNDEDCCSSFHSRFVTIGDARRIAKATGKKLSDFLVYAELKDRDKETDLYRKRPHGYYYDLAVNGKILQIRDGKKGECPFFDKGSCQIYPSRPLACRVFPLWFSGKRIIVDSNGLDCPIVCGKKPLKTPGKEHTRAGMRKMGCSEGELKWLLSQLRGEMDEYRTNIKAFARKNRL